MRAELWVGADPEAVAGEAARRFVQVAAGAVAAHGRFSVGLAGGSTPRRLYELLAAGAAAVDWARTTVFFSDERCVPPDHPDSNYRMAQAALLAQVPATVHRVQGEAPPEAAAAAYAAEIGWGALDLLLLGMGADGHTASLFPGSPALQEQERPAVAVWAAHLNMWRVTLTLPALNRARQVLVLVTGAEKAAMLQRALAEPAADLPIQRVAPAGSLAFLVDRAAAQLLRPEGSR